MAKTPNPAIGERVYPPLRDPANFWTDNNGRCTLRGVPGDPDNPAVLPDFHIVNALQRSQKAHDDLQKLLPILLPEERDRLNNLLAENPYLVKTIDKTAPSDDRVQQRFNDIPVYFAGRFRGAGRRHNVIKNTYPIPEGNND